MKLYRFEQLVGNAVVIRLLKRSIANKALPNMCAFLGVIGTGKTTSAGIAALAITCEHPVDGEPCLQCDRCKYNLKVLDGSGSGRYIKTINAAKLLNKKDVHELVGEIFNLVPENGNVVYIINEFHDLNKLGDTAQTIFLEEITRMPSNVYVFITSSHEEQILPALLSRGIKFVFNRLTSKESIFLLDRLCRLGNIHFQEETVKKLIIESTKGIPRDIVSAVDFFSKSQVTVEEYKEFTGIVSDQSFLNLLISMYDKNIVNMKTVVEELLEKKKGTYFVNQMKDFFVKCMFYKEAGIVEDFDVDKEMLSTVIQEVDIFSILTRLDRLNYKSSDSDIQLFLYNLRNTIKGRTTLDVITESKKIAYSSSQVAAVTKRETDKYTENASAGTLLTMNSFNFLEEN